MIYLICLVRGDFFAMKQGQPGVYTPFLRTHGWKSAAFAHSEVTSFIVHFVDFLYFSALLLLVFLGRYFEFWFSSEWNRYGCGNCGRYICCRLRQLLLNRLPSIAVKRIGLLSLSKHYLYVYTIKGLCFNPVTHHGTKRFLWYASNVSISITTWHIEA